MATNPNSYNIDCNWRFGLNLRPTLKGSVGYLLTWSGCGGLNLQKDIEVWNPFDSPGQRVISGPRVKCIGLIESFRFEGGDNDPIRIKCFLSKGNATEVRSRLGRPLTSTTLKVAWYIIDFDEEDKIWFESAFIKSPKTADAVLDSMGGSLQIFADNTPTRIDENLDINVYGFEFQIVPPEEKSVQLEFATGPKRRLVKKWGE